MQDAVPLDSDQIVQKVTGNRAAKIDDLEESDQLRRGALRVDLGEELQLPGQEAPCPPRRFTLARHGIGARLAIADLT